LVTAAGKQPRKGHSVYSTLTNTASTSDGGLRTLEKRKRDGDREGEVVLHGGGNTAAAKGVLFHLHPLGDSPCRNLADRGARVPEVLPTGELEGFLTGLIIAMPVKPVGGAAVGDDAGEARRRFLVL